MRAVRYSGPGQRFTLQSVAVPDPGPGEVRVKIAACGVCHTELHFRDGLLDLGSRDITMGHEIAGLIDAVGPNVDPARVGTRVAVYYYEGCENCRYCRAGDEQLCPSPAGQAGFTTDGGFADYIVTRARNCVPVPAHVALTDIAPMGCAGTTAVHAGKMAAPRPGEWAVIQGFGGVGAAMLQYLRAAGARVIAIGLGPARLKLALSLGAEVAIDAGEIPNIVDAVRAVAGEGADIVFDLVGTTTSMTAAVEMLRRRGRLVFVGYSAENFSIHPTALIVKELRLLASVGSTLEDLHDVVALVAAGTIKPITDLILPLEDFETALTALESGKLRGRAVLQIS